MKIIFQFKIQWVSLFGMGILLLIMAPETVSINSVGIAVFADDHFQRVQEHQHATIKCYAIQHGYDWLLINPDDYPECSTSIEGHFFFVRHCALRMFLATKPDGYTVLVLDGDVIGGLAEQNLDRWIGGKDANTDLIFYERMQLGEIAASSFIVRNSEFTRTFLKTWYDFYLHSPPGFSSSDNGAIHLVLLSAIGFKEQEHCFSEYRRLSKSQDQPGWWEEYFEFVACARHILGPARRWHVYGAISGVITIWPQFHSWIEDYNLIPDPKFNSHFPFSHGVKDIDEFWHESSASPPVFSNNQCNFSSVLPRATLEDLLPFFHEGIPTRSPYPFFQLGDCADTLSCEPLDDSIHLENVSLAPDTGRPFRKLYGETIFPRPKRRLQNPSKSLLRVVRAKLRPDKT